MNSKKLADFNKKLFALLLEHQWNIDLGMNKKSLKACVVVAERNLFSESEIHPNLLEKNTRYSFLKCIPTVFWLFFYVLVAYFSNLLVRSIVSVRKAGLNKKNQSAYYSVSPAGKISNTYSLLFNKEILGIAISIIGANSWRKVFSSRQDNEVFETLLSVNPYEWIFNFFILSKKIYLIQSRVSFGSTNRSKSIAKFFYFIFKQITMRKRVEKVESFLEKDSIILFSAESISYLLMEKLMNGDFKVCHHIHGMVLANNLIVEPPLSQYIITGSPREANFLKKYKEVLVYSSIPPIQMLEDINSASIDKNMVSDDILLVASFELPFIQKSTYSMLEKSLSKIVNHNIVIRHHPRVPSKSKIILNNAIPFSRVSEGKSLVEDINRSKVVICCSVDALVISLLMEKNTIFIPMIDGEYKSHTRDFTKVISNLWCPNSSEEITKYVDKALSKNTSLPLDYKEKIEYLFGSSDVECFYNVLKFISKSDNNKESLL